MVCNCCMPAPGCEVLVAHHTHGPQSSSCCGHHQADPSHITIYNSNITYVVISKTILMTVSFIINNISVEL